MNAEAVPRFTISRFTGTPLPVKRMKRRANRQRANCHCIRAFCTTLRLLIGRLSFTNSFREGIFDQHSRRGAHFANEPNLGKLVPEDRSMNAMNLWVWLPALFVIGAATMAALFAFVLGCEKV